MGTSFVYGWCPIAMFDFPYLCDLYVIVALIVAKRSLVEGPSEVRMMVDDQ